MKKIECVIMDWAGTAVDYGWPEAAHGKVAVS